MSIVLRYVDKNGYVKERFYGLVHVKDTDASTLKDGICFPLSQYNLDVHNIRGQGYDEQKFYPSDFAEHEMMQLRMQFEHFDHVRQLSDFKSLETISNLCQWLVKTRKSEIYPLVYRVVTLILTLPVSTVTTERSFSAMNIIKNKLHNKIEDEFLSNCLLIYIEKEIAETFDVDSIISDFCDMKERRVSFY
ncbi:hypothetical protein like AT1G19260 [Hibiscus trionum]|uniref:HAT C-terminal dimerisation domain-containing protein n=2 Tax=Hibiscus trionum TaxID=183268 RepID=A0A9W7I110_HIBTR|nr:hypothetical protein like AT1G19260 [Hibiscus trionum]